MKKGALKGLSLLLLLLLAVLLAQAKKNLNST